MVMERTLAGMIGWRTYPPLEACQMRKRTLHATNRAVVRARFLDALGRLGIVTEAAKVAGVSKAAAYLWRQTDPDFAAAWAEAMQLGINALEDHAAELAANGSEALTMFLLRAGRPEKYRPGLVVNATAANDAWPPLDPRHRPLDDLRRELAELLALATIDQTDPKSNGDHIDAEDTAVRNGN